MAEETPQILQYIVDTRPLWPQATKTGELQTHASRALAALNETERQKVLRFYFVADAKMALVSHLLKHWAVARGCGVPWAQTTLGADANGKPIYAPVSSSPDGRQQQKTVHFNVSHQAGLVALAAVAGYAGPGPVDVGTDVVCTSERRDRDRRLVAAEGWAHFVDMHAEVFGAGEADYLKRDIEPQLQQQMWEAEAEGRGQGPTGSDLLDAKLRAFYTLWCLREAYVKMTGDALLAPWLGELKFLRFRAPEPGVGASAGAVGELLASGDREPGQEERASRQVIREHEITFKGQKVVDANICLRAVGPSYMTCTAVRTPQKTEDALSWKLGPFEPLGLDEILETAEAA